MSGKGLSKDIQMKSFRHSYLLTMKLVAVNELQYDVSVLTWRQGERYTDRKARLQSRTTSPNDEIQFYASFCAKWSELSTFFTLLQQQRDGCYFFRNLNETVRNTRRMSKSIFLLRRPLGSFRVSSRFLPCSIVR